MISEREKQSGVCYALTNDGIELPVVDVTLPALVEQASDSEQAIAANLDLLRAQAPARTPVVGSFSATPGRRAASARSAA